MAKLRAVWDGSRRERAVGIQPGFSPETPDTGWKPMLQCSPECRAISQSHPSSSSPNISYADLNRGRFFANWPIMSHFRQVHRAVDL